MKSLRKDTPKSSSKEGLKNHIVAFTEKLNSGEIENFENVLSILNNQEYVKILNVDKEILSTFNSLYDLTVSKMASAISEMSLRDLSSINAQEFLSCSDFGKPKVVNAEAPTISNAIKSFNKLSNWISQDILVDSSANKGPSEIDILASKPANKDKNNLDEKNYYRSLNHVGFWINVADKCLMNQSMPDVNGAIAVRSALQRGYTMRLYRNLNDKNNEFNLLSELGNNTVNKLVALEKITAEDQSYKEVRQLMDKNPNSLPYVGMMTSDMTFLNTNPDGFNKNMMKLEKIVVFNRNINNMKSQSQMENFSVEKSAASKLDGLIQNEISEEKLNAASDSIKGRNATPPNNKHLNTSYKLIEEIANTKQMNELELERVQKTMDREFNVAYQENIEPSLPLLVLSEKDAVWIESLKQLGFAVYTTYDDLIDVNSGFQGMEKSQKENLKLSLEFNANDAVNNYNFYADNKAELNNTVLVNALVDSMLNNEETHFTNSSTLLEQAALTRFVALALHLSKPETKDNIRMMMQSFENTSVKEINNTIDRLSKEISLAKKQGVSGTEIESLEKNLAAQKKILINYYNVLGYKKALSLTATNLSAELGRMSPENAKKFNAAKIPDPRNPDNEIAIGYLMITLKEKNNVDLEQVDDFWNKLIPADIHANKNRDNRVEVKESKKFQAKTPQVTNREKNISFSTRKDSNSTPQLSQSRSSSIGANDQTPTTGKIQSFLTASHKTSVSENSLPPFSLSNEPDPVSKPVVRANSNIRTKNYSLSSRTPKTSSTPETPTNDSRERVTTGPTTK